MSAKQIVIYGAGGFAREVAWLVESCCEGKQPYCVACFVDDDVQMQGKILNGLPVLDLATARVQYPGALAIVAVGSPTTRQLMAQKAAAIGFSFATLVHPRVERSQWIEVGQGTVICAGNILTTNITLGEHVQVNVDCTIGHNAILGDYTTLAPGVHVSGWVHFGRRVYVGTGAVIINGTKDRPLTIADDVVIGAGACVTKSVEAGLTVVGVPARPLQR